MNKSSKIILLIVTIAFVGITAWRVVAWSTRQSEQSKRQVVEISLVGPDTVDAGEFDESQYKLTVKRVDQSVGQENFYKGYLDENSYKMLFEEGEHTIAFTYENCRGTFDITVVGNAEVPVSEVNVWIILPIVIGSVFVLTVIVVIIVVIVQRKRKNKIDAE